MRVYGRCAIAHFLRTAAGKVIHSGTTTPGPLHKTPPPTLAGRFPWGSRTADDVAVFVNDSQ
jgi:hypothetical protein